MMNRIYSLFDSLLVFKYFIKFALKREFKEIICILLPGTTMMKISCVTQVIYIDSFVTLSCIYLNHFPFFFDQRILGYSDFTIKSELFKLQMETTFYMIYHLR